MASNDDSSGGGLTVEQIPGLLEHPDFLALPHEELGPMLEKALDEAGDNLRQSGEWSPETYRTFGEFANTLRSKLPPETWGETAAWAGRAVGGLAVGLARAAEGAAFDLNPVGHVPLSDTWKVFDAKAEQAGAAVDQQLAKLHPEHGALKTELGQFQQQLDQGEFPFHPEKFDGWLRGWNERLGTASSRYYRANDSARDDAASAAYAVGNGLQNPRNAGLLSRYLRTRDPAAWNQFRKNVEELPWHAKNREAEETALQESETAKLMDRTLTGSTALDGGSVGQEAIRGAGDPINLAATVLPILRAAKGEGSALKSLLKGQAEAVAMGEAGHLAADPGASLQEQWENAKTMFVGALGLHAATKAISVAGDRLTRSRGVAEKPEAETVSPSPSLPVSESSAASEGASDADFAAAQEALAKAAPSVSENPFAQPQDSPTAGGGLPKPLAEYKSLAELEDDLSSSYGLPKGTDELWNAISDAEADRRSELDMAEHNQRYPSGGPPKPPGSKPKSTGEVATQHSVEDGDEKITLHREGAQIGRVDFREEKSKAFTDVTQGAPTYRISGIQVTDTEQGQGLGQRLYLEAMAKHPDAWYFNSQTYTAAGNALRSLARKGLIELHETGHPSQGDIGPNIKRITPKGLEAISKEAPAAAANSSLDQPPPLPPHVYSMDATGLLTLGRALHTMARQARDVASFTVSALKQFGEWIQPHLQSIWESAKRGAEHVANYFKGAIQAAKKSSRVGAVGDVRPAEIQRKLEEARAAATMPNAPESESQARPLKDEFGVAVEDYTAFTRDDMRARAGAMVDAVGSLDDMSRLLSTEDGVRSLGLHPALQEFVQAETLKRARNAVDAAGNDVDRIRATQTMRRIKSLWDVTGTEAGQHLAARNLAGQEIREALPDMSVDEAIDKQQKATIDRAVGGDVEPVTKAVETAQTEAAPVATRKVAEALQAVTPRRTKKLDAAEKARRAAEGVLKQIAQTHADPQIWKDRSQPHPVVQLYREHLAKPMPQEEFARRLSELKVKPELAGTLAEAANLEIRARADIKLEKERQSALGEATDVADGILDRIAETHADPQSWPDKSKPHPVTALYRQHLESPMEQSEFTHRLTGLGVDPGVANTLGRAANLEIEARSAVARGKAELKEAQRAQMADAQAGKLIYDVSLKHRQAGTPLVQGPHVASIRSLFSQVVNKGLPFDQFAGALRKLRVSDVVIDRLYRVAERERGALDEAAVLEARRKLLERDSPGLAKLLNTLMDKIAPGLQWRDIFTSQKADQRSWELQVYDRIRKHEALQGLSHGEAVELTRELSKAWQRERRTVFNRELSKQLSKVSNLKPAAAAKVEKSAPRLLQLINLGAFDSAAFRDAVAKEWGIQHLNSPEAKRLRDLAIRMQQAPEGLPRRKFAQQFIEGLQDLTKLTKAELLESWWTAAVLSGWRTHMDIGLAVANGIEDVGLGSIITALRTGNRDVAWRALWRVIANLPTAASEALHHVVTGDKSMMRNFDAELKEALEDGHKMMNNAGRQLLNKGGFAKAPGAFMEFIARMLTALDHLNSSSTFEGTKLMSMARHPELYKAALEIGPREKTNARAQARNELTGGADPKNRTEWIQENARVKEILDAGIPTEIIAQATELGRDAALQGEPTGLGYAVYWLSRQLGGIFGSAEKWAEQGLAENPNVMGHAVLAMLRRASTAGRVISGTKFIRTAAHALNRNLSYYPGLGLVRFAEGGMKGPKSDILIAKQLLGTAVGLSLYGFFKGKKDDEEGLEGPWKGLNAQQRSQLYAQGKQPNTVWFRNAKGKTVSFNYLQWGLGGILATVGAMNDQRRYHDAKDEFSVLMNGLAAGSMAWSDKAQLQGLQQVFGDSAYSSSNVGDSLASKLNRYAATTVGGLVPRIGKDIDQVISPELHDSREWWAKWAAQVPMLRETSTGKRVDIFGQDIKLDRGPLSRVVQFGPDAAAYRTLGQLNQRDVWLPDPTTGVRKVKLPDGSRRDLTPAEKDRYQRHTGEGYKQFIQEHGAEILALPQDRAKDYIQRHTKFIRDRAAYQATHP